MEKLQALAWFVLVAACVLIPSERVLAAEKWNTKEEVSVKMGDCTYRAYLSSDKTESWIYRVELESRVRKLKFPEKIQDAPVTRLGFGRELFSDPETSDYYISIFGDLLEPWHGVYGEVPGWGYNEEKYYIESVVFPSELKTIEKGCFSGMLRLRKLRFPKELAELKEYTILACDSLTTVIFPEKMKKFHSGAFDKCRSIAFISISSDNANFMTKQNFLLGKRGKTLVWAAPATKTIVIPGSVKKISARALKGSRAGSVVLPKSVEYIGSKALCGKYIKKVELKKGNKVYKIKNGCIYEKKNGRITAVLVERGCVKIPSEVKILGGGVSVMGKNIKRVYVPKAAKKKYTRWIKKHGWLGLDDLYTY